MTLSRNSAFDARNLSDEVLSIVRDFPDFPKPGILFKDISPLLRNASAFKRVIRHMAEYSHAQGATQIVGIESRGFLFGVPLALELALPFVPARKKGKLPGELYSQEYSLEYGTDIVQMQKESLPAGSKSIIVDDVIATGGTAAAVGKIVEGSKGELAGFCFLIELGFLPGRAQLASLFPTSKVDSLLVL